MQKKWQKRVKNTPKQGIFRLFNSLPIVKMRVSPIVKMRIFQLPSPLYPPAGTSGSLEKAIEIFWSSQLANLWSSQLANYWTVGKCLVSVCFSPFSAIFFAFTPFSCTYKTNFEKKSVLTWIFCPRWRLKHFAGTQGGSPPPTQLTNTKNKIWK